MEIGAREKSQQDQQQQPKKEKENTNCSPISSSTSSNDVVIGISIDDDDDDSSLLAEKSRSPTTGVAIVDDRFSASSLNRSYTCIGEHENVQKKAFTKWLNSHLGKKNYPRIGDLYTDLRDGTILIALLDVLYDCRIKLERGRLRVHHLNNAARALQVLAERQVKLVNISTNDIVDGNEKLTLGLVWCIILNWQVNHILRHATGKFSEFVPRGLPKAGVSGVPQPGSSVSGPNLKRTGVGGSRIPLPPPPLYPKPKQHQHHHVAASTVSHNPMSYAGELASASSSSSSSTRNDNDNRSAAIIAGMSSVNAPTNDTPTLGTMSQNDLEKTLLAWCQAETANYEGVHIKNFTTSWSDGLAFNALIHHFRPRLFSYGEVLAMQDAHTRLQHAFDVAVTHLGIEKLLDPEDLNTPRPDKKSVIVYVMCLFQKFTGQSEQQQQQQQQQRQRTPPISPKPSTNIPVLSGGIEHESSQSSTSLSATAATTITRTSPASSLPIPISGLKKPTVAVQPSSSQQQPQQQKQHRFVPSPNPAQSNIPVLSPTFVQKRSQTASKTAATPDSKKICLTGADSTPTAAAAASAAPSQTGILTFPKTGVPARSESGNAFDADFLEEYHSDIEDILTWLLGSEEQLSTAAEDDFRRFDATTNATKLDLDALTSVDSDAERFNQLRHNRIMSTIEAAEYAKQRFEFHEEFMRELADYHRKIVKTFDKGKRLIYAADTTSPSSSSSSSSAGQSPSKLRSPSSFTGSSSGFGSTSSSGSTASSAIHDVESKKVVALQMKLLDDRFNKLRVKANNHQQYLHQMLIQTQNAQLEELRRLMTQTEERIAVIIPARSTEMPSDAAALDAQMREFEQLEQAMMAEQGLLNLISKFVIIDTDDNVTASSSSSSTAAKESNFLDQLDALNERWSNACRITEERGKFLRKLAHYWHEYAAEQSRLADWFNRLERRLDDMEESIEEIEAKPLDDIISAPLPAALRQEKKFLDDIHARLERMFVDIMYGTDRSQKMHASGVAGGEQARSAGRNEKEKEDDDDKEDDEMLAHSTPLSKINTVIRSLIGLGESGVCARVANSVAMISHRWETLTERIEHAKIATEKRLKGIEQALKRQPSHTINDDKPLDHKSTKSFPSSASTTSGATKRDIPTISATTKSETPFSSSTGTTADSAKRRKIDFCGVVDWQNLLDSMAERIECIESQLIGMSISGELVETFTDRNRPPIVESLQPINFSTATACLQRYQSLLHDRTPMHTLLEQCFELKRDDSSSATLEDEIRAELEQINTMQVELDNHRRDFEDIVKRGNKIIADFKLANEEYQSLASVLDSFCDRWKVLRDELTRCKLLSEVWYAMRRMIDQSGNMRHVLEKYRKRFAETLEIICSIEGDDDYGVDQRSAQSPIIVSIEQKERIDALRQQVDFCSITIDGQYSKIDECNRKLTALRQQVPELFLCWPELTEPKGVNDVANLPPFPWRRIALERLFSDERKMTISSFQWSCFKQSIDLMWFYELWLTMSEAGKFLHQKLDRIQKFSESKSVDVIDGEKTIEKNKSSTSDEVLSFSDLSLNDELVDSSGGHSTATDKLLVAIDALNSWLKEVIQVIEVYEEDEDDEEEEEVEEEVQKSDDDGDDTANAKQQRKVEKMPGSGLKSFGDLANAIDNRIEELVDLQKTVNGGQEDYQYACRRAAKIIFAYLNRTESTADQSDDESSETLETIESSLKSIDIASMAAAPSSLVSLVESIQQLIDRWNHVADRFATLLHQLDDISPSTTVLEAEYAAVARWIEDAATFLGDGIAIGDLDTLAEQLCECERLKEHMESSVVKTFQPLLDTAKEAVRILFGKYRHVQVPVVQEIEKMWRNLSKRSTAKLERLRVAQELSQRLIKTLDDHQAWLREFEIEFLREGGREVDKNEFPLLYQQFLAEQKAQHGTEDDNDGDTERFNWKSAIPSMMLLDRLRSKRSAYLHAVLEPPNSLISRMSAFQASTHQTQAFEQQKKRAKIELVRAFDTLENKCRTNIAIIESHLDNLARLVRLIARETSLVDRFAESLADARRTLPSLADDTDAERLRQSLDRLNAESVCSARQTRLDQIRALLAKNSNLFQFLLDTGQQPIIEQQQDQLQRILADDSRHRADARTIGDSLREFLADYQQFDAAIIDLHQWLKQQYDRRSATAALHHKRDDLHQIEQYYLERLAAYSGAAKHVQNRVKFLDEIFAEFLQNDNNPKNVAQSIAADNDDEPIINVAREIGKLEQMLADIGTAINEMEISVDDDELQASIAGATSTLSSTSPTSATNFDVEAMLQSLPVCLQKVIDNDCAKFDQQLKQFETKLAPIRRAETLSQESKSRLQKLIETHASLRKALHFRRTLITELIDLCTQINRKLVLLERECSKIIVAGGGGASPSSSSAAKSAEQLTRIKENSIEILNEVCALKERLDIHCISQSDVLIGIEEVGSKYDEIITEIAERYLDDEEEEEEEEEEGGESKDRQEENGDSAGGGGGGPQVPPAIPEQIRFRPANNNVSAAVTSAAHLSTITEEISSPPEAAASVSDQKILIDCKSSIAEKTVVVTKTITTTTIAISKTVIESKSPPGDTKKSCRDFESIEQEIDFTAAAIRRIPYSVKPYIRQLADLERKIRSICSATIGHDSAKQPSSSQKLSISLVEDELHRLNKSLNAEVRVPYELYLCVGAFFGIAPFTNAVHHHHPDHRLLSLEKRTKNEKKADLDISAKTSNEDDETQLDSVTARWDQHSAQTQQSLERLRAEFGVSWNRFLSLHRHWWLVRDATLQFNSEIRKLADWFENVELQLTNGRLRTTVIDDSAEPYGCFGFDVTDLNLPTIARTQLLLITQLKTHVPIYAKIEVLYHRLCQCFTPEDERTCEMACDARVLEDRKALIDARARIQHEMDQVSMRWRTIVRELAWRRECLVALASGRLPASVTGFAFNRGRDTDFDRVLDDFLRYESMTTTAPPSATIPSDNENDDDAGDKWYPREQLLQWQHDTSQILANIRAEYVVSDIESAHRLFSQLRELQFELSRQYLNWMVVTQQPFIDGVTTSPIIVEADLRRRWLPRIDLRSMEDIVVAAKSINDTFGEVTADLFNVCYFTEVYMTCFAYISQLIKSEFEWVITAHEHLNSIEDYLELRTIDRATSRGAVADLPLESLTFVESLKNTLISHENNIEQIVIIVRELTQHASELSLRVDLSEFMIEFEHLSSLRHHLVARLRGTGRTAWVALHHLLKQCYHRLQSYRKLRLQSPASSNMHIGGPPNESMTLIGLSPQSRTGSLRFTSHSQPHPSHHQSARSMRSAIDGGSSSLQRQQATQRQQLALIADLRTYYHSTLQQFNRWLAFETFILFSLCSRCFPSATTDDYRNDHDDRNDRNDNDDDDDNDQQREDQNRERIDSTAALPPSKILKFTIRRTEDFLTEFNFALLVLAQLRSELELLEQQQQQQSSTTVGVAAAAASPSLHRNGIATTSATASAAHEQSGSIVGMQKKQQQQQQQDDEPPPQPAGPSCASSASSSPGSGKKWAPSLNDVPQSSPPPPPLLEPLNHSYYATIETQIMERVRDLQREHHRRSLHHLLQQQSVNTGSGPGAGPGPGTTESGQNLYDTVADALSTALDGAPHPAPPQPVSPCYRRPSDLPEMNSSANLDSQRTEIESWLCSVEKRFTDFIREYSNNNYNNNNQNNHNGPLQSQQQESIASEAWLKKQLTIISNYQSELNQHSAKLSALSNAIDARIASLAPKGGASSLAADISKANISMPYYNHLLELRKHADEMQIRLNDLYLSIKCKLRSLQEIWSCNSSSGGGCIGGKGSVTGNSASSRINLISGTSGITNGVMNFMMSGGGGGSGGGGNGAIANSIGATGITATTSSNANSGGANNGGLDLGIDFHNTSSLSLKSSSSPKSSPSMFARSSSSSSSSSTTVAINAAIASAARNAVASGTAGTGIVTVGPSSLCGSGGGDSGSASTVSSQATAVAGAPPPPTARNAYALHEQTEKRFAKWLSEIEQSVQFIEKRMEAESVMSNTGQAPNDGDDPLYSNVSEMQQMHMNYFEKVKIMQREIEQKRTDHRILMELLESESDSEITTRSPQSANTTTTTTGITTTTATGVMNGTEIANAAATTTTSGERKRSAMHPDAWLSRFRVRIETLNNRWNSMRLRVLTLRSRLETNSIYAIPALTTTIVPSSSSLSSSGDPRNMSLYSINGYAAVTPSLRSSEMAEVVAFNCAAAERSSQLLLSLRELVEWIIGRQTEFESQQHAQQQQQQQAQQQHQSNPMRNVPLDVANVLQQKAALARLRTQLAEKRPIIDSSLLACHNLLRRLAIKRARDAQSSHNRSAATNQMTPSASIASSIAASGAAGAGSGDFDSRLRAVRNAKRAELAQIEASLTREMQRLLDIWNTLQVDVEMRIQRLDDAHLRLTDLQRAMENLGAKLHEAEYSKSQWTPLSAIAYDQIPQHKALLKNYNQLYVAPIARDAVYVNELAARLTGRNVPLSHANLKALEELTTRSRLLQVALDERARELEQAIHDHGSAQQHFLTEAVDAPWERAVTANKLPCYINRATESVHVVSPKYIEIMSSLADYNRVRYAAYRSAMKLRALQSKLELDYVTLDILAEAFEQHGLGPNAPLPVPQSQQQPQPPHPASSSSLSSSPPPPIPRKQSNTKSNTADDGDDIEQTTATKSESKTAAADSNLATASSAADINADLPYELRLISVPEIVSCLKLIFEMVAATAAAELNGENDEKSSGAKRKSKDKKMDTNNKADSGQSAERTDLSSSSSNFDKNGERSSDASTAASAAVINVPMCVDLCLNWVLALYDAPSRSGYIRQFSFQVAMVLLSKISLEQKYLYLFNLIADDNGRADERRLGLLIYDCLRLPKLLGEVAAFGGTNIEPSVRSCLEMAGQCGSTTTGNGVPGPAGSVTAEQVLAWIRAEPQSLVWMLVLHRLRLAEKSRHPAKCNLCRRYPIVGFRYRCLKCFNFDLCQDCFLCDMATKKHKSSHPMQEYCVATTSGEDMRDFTRILRNKFKSGRYFKRHQALGYLPVQSLHEGDRLEEAAAAAAAASLGSVSGSMTPYSTIRQLGGGSYSHNPSANTTPVHTLPYPTPRAASPGALTQRDLDFVLDSGAATSGPRGAGGRFTAIADRGIMPSSSAMMMYDRVNRRQGLIEHHNQPQQQHQQQPELVIAKTVNPFDRRLPQYHSTPASPVYRNRSMIDDDEVHSRVGHYANRLAEAEQMRTTLAGTTSGALNRSNLQRNRASNANSKFDSLPSGRGGYLAQTGEVRGLRTLPHEQQRQQQSSDSINHFDLSLSPTEMLSKIAADQRSELEQIIQRLEEENKMLITEYNQLKDEPTTTTTTTTKPKMSTTQQPTSENERHRANHDDDHNVLIDRDRNKTTKKSYNFDEDDDDRRAANNNENDEDIPLYENVKNSLERRQRERQRAEEASKKSTITTNGHDSDKDYADHHNQHHHNSNDTTVLSNESGINVPPHLLEEARYLRENKHRLETRTIEMEKCNRLLETQLNQFKQYISSSGALDSRTKNRLALSIVDMERTLDVNDDATNGGKNRVNDSTKSSTKPSVNGDLDSHDLSPLDDNEHHHQHQHYHSRNSSNFDDNGQRSTISASNHSARLNTEAVRVSSAMENLVGAITEPSSRTNTSCEYDSRT